MRKNNKTKIFEVKISYKKGVEDAEGETTLKALKLLGFEEVKDVKTAKVYVIKGSLTKAQVAEMCEKLLANPVSQDYDIREIKK